MNLARHAGFPKLTQKEISEAVARHEMLYSGRLGARGRPLPSATYPA